MDINKNCKLFINLSSNKTPNGYFRGINIINNKNTKTESNIDKQ